jgi:predicted DNA-binding protein with PD1-like motif
MTPTQFLVFKPGDEVIETLLRLGIDSAQIIAIGGFEEATVAYWNRETKQYEDHDFNEQMEVISLIGSISRVEQSNGGQADHKVHAHVTLGRRDLTTIGGHLKRGVVYPTLEMTVIPIDPPLSRERDEATGLDLLTLR